MTLDGTTRTFRLESRIASTEQRLAWQRLHVERWRSQGRDPAKLLEVVRTLEDVLATWEAQREGMIEASQSKRI